MAVRIRLKQMGRRHRPYYRVCAMDSRTPRDGKVLEELGSYDPMVIDTNARAVLNGERIDYWLGVGALPTEKVKTLIKKYGSSGTHLEQQKVALERMAQPKAVPDPGAPASLPKKPEPKPAAAETATDGQAAADDKKKAKPADSTAVAEGGETAEQSDASANGAEETTTGQADNGDAAEETATEASSGDESPAAESDTGEETKT